MKGFISILAANSAFSIRPSVAGYMLQHANDVLNKIASFDSSVFGGLTESERKKILAFGDSIEVVRDLDGEVIGQVQVITLHGTMFKEGQFCGPSSAAAFSRDVRQAADNPEISSIVIDLYTPGGQVDGTVERAEAVAYARSKKHVTAFVNSGAYSGGYWVAVEADEIVMSDPTAGTGSIGVVCSYIDKSGIIT